MSAQGNDKSQKFSVFRWQAASPHAGIPIMEYGAMSETAQQGAADVMAAGMDTGHENRLLFHGGGFSLVYVWFKSDYPLPRHSHDCDCLYFLLAGSLKIGTHNLNQGDGFFVGANVPYAYTPGPEGAEVLEFRATENFDIKVLADGAGFWQKALHRVQENHQGWQDQLRPSHLPSFAD